MDVELRPRFYEGQYLGADDLSSIVAYLRTAQARHALGGHTWGIAIGLQLTERSAPGGQDRVEVTLQPGFGWDGYGRPILNPRPTRLNEDLFAAIPYHPILDDVANGGFGRVVEVWLQYTETASGNPAPGFETCATDDQHARITESFRFEIGQQAESRQRDKVTIGTSSVDAKQALTTFGATDVLHDASVPHQQFAYDEKPRRWLVPLGYVRWIARDQALGYFAKGDLDPAHPTAPRTRAFRRYVGSVAEYIEAADGAIVLHKRSTDPKSPHLLSTLLDNATTPAEVTALLDDLVWVQGNLRVVGQAKLCRELLFRNRNGVDENTTLYMARRGDNPPVPGDGNRELHIVIGPDSQTTNRLVVGPEVPPAGVSTQPTTAPHLVVVSSGDVGLGTHDPTARLNIVGNRIRLQNNSAAAKRLELRVDGDGVGMESPTDSMTLRSFGAFGKNKVLINPDANDGQVGIRVQSPQHDVDAKGRSIKLGMEVDGGGQLVLTHDAADNVVLEGRNAAGTGSAAELRIAGRNSASVPILSARADSVDVRASRIKLGLEGNGGGQLVLVNNTGDNKIFLEGFSTDGTGDASEILITGIFGGQIPRVTIKGDTTQFTGNVGIGTAVPQDTLHVVGDFIRVNGAGNEQAYIGGDGVASDVQVGSVNAAIQKVVLYNRTSGNGMDLICRNITCDDIDGDVIVCDTLFEISDAEYKQDITPVRNALETLAQLQGIRFRWKAGRPRANQQALGVVAQEVRKVLPEAVRETPKGATVSYTALIPVLIEAVKDLKGEVDALRDEVQQMKTASKPKAAPTRKKNTEHPS